MPPSEMGEAQPRAADSSVVERLPVLIFQCIS